MKTPLTMALAGGFFFTIGFAMVACTAPTSAPDDDLSAVSELTADGGDAGPHCHAAHIHAADGTKGPYCPFQASGAVSTCAAKQHCCESSQSGSVSTCSATSCTFAVAPDAGHAGGGGADFECDSKTECPQGQVCCLLGEVKPTSTPGCTDLVGVNVRGTACRTSCGTAEPAICAQQSDCSQGTCTPFATKGKDLGFCK
jgi:hypothetical protein